MAYGGDDIVYSVVGIGNDILNKSPFELSGGQKRRAAMAGVLAMQPGILVLDEPASGLDPRGRQEMFAIIKKLRDSGTTIILVSHNMDEAAVNCDRICLIDHGKIKAVGTPEELFIKERAEELLGEYGYENIDEIKLCDFITIGNILKKEANNYGKRFI